MKRIDRFDKYMEIKGLNDNRVTVELGLSIGTLGKSRQAGRDLSDKSVEKILNFYTDLNKVWLLTGEGEILNNNKQLLKDNSAVVNGNGNSVVSGENNKLEVSKCKDDLEVAMLEIKHLKERLKDKEEMIEILKNQLNK